MYRLRILFNSRVQLCVKGTTLSCTCGTTDNELGLNFSIRKSIIMAAEIITKEDLQEFGERLLGQMKALISGGSTEEPRKFLKSYQVKNLLRISNNTLQTLRDNGTIPFTKIGGILYYNYEDIMKVLKGEVKSKRISFSK